MPKNIFIGISKIPGLFLEFSLFLKGLRTIARALCKIIKRLLVRDDKQESRQQGNCCKHLPTDVYKRPDPLIYAQYYLMKMGLSVAWDNPDIQLFELDAANPDGIGTAISSTALKPDHFYRVRVRVWNGSYDAPIAGLPVYLSYLSFGVGTASTNIGERLINLGVKGSSQHPAYAFFDWRTPATEGHYCLQARLEWADDANPDNNLGQENVNVGALHSPAEFSFLLRNDASVSRQFVVEADAYRLPELLPCDDPKAEIPVMRTNSKRESRLTESRARWKRALSEQAYGNFPVPPDWTVLINPDEVFLLPDEERTIHVSIEPKNALTDTPKAFNINVFALNVDNQRSYEGGVTLYVTKT